MQVASTSPSSKPFRGLRFLLCGFDPINRQQVRSKLLSGGGVESQNYTHLIVDNTIYDDPACVSARNDGKAVITGLWVDHSFDIGLVVDSTSIIYQPPKDLNGIPGADRLFICLTGYQRQDREDIMTMVSLMGARFLKHLVAKDVTHLICYKFEGTSFFQFNAKVLLCFLWCFWNFPIKWLLCCFFSGQKYELARKMPNIKLVNHRWLEDCLRIWKLLPEDDYYMSGYYLEMMGAEASDSEVDVVETSLLVSASHIANQNLQIVEDGSPRTCNLSKPTPEFSAIPAGTEGYMCAYNPDEVLRTPANKNMVDIGCGRDKNHASDLIAGLSERTPGSMIAGSKVDSVSRSVGKTSLSYMNSTAKSHDRKTPQMSSSSLFIGASLGLGCSPEVQIGEPINITSAKTEVANQRYVSDFEKFERLVSEELADGRKQSTDPLKYSPKSHEIVHDRLASGRTSVSSRARGLKSSLLNGALGLNKNCGDGGYARSGYCMLPLSATSNTHGKLTFREKSLAEGVPFGENAALEIIGNQSTNMKYQASVSGLKGSSSPCKQDNEVLCVDKSEVVDLANQQEEALPPSEINIPTLKDYVVATDQRQDESLQSKLARKHTATKKTLGSRMKLKNTVKEKGSIYLKENTGQEDLATDPLRRNDRTDGEENFLMAKELEIIHASSVPMKNMEKKLVIHLRSDVQDNTGFMNDETEPPDDREQLSEALLKDGIETGGLAASTVEKEPEEVHPVGENSNDCEVDDVMEDPLKKDDLISEGDDGKWGLTSVKSMRKIASTVDGKSSPSKAVEAEKAHLHTVDQAAENKSELNHGSCPSSKKLSRRRSRITMEADEENQSITKVHKSGSMAGKHVESSETEMDSNQEALEGKPPSGELKEISTHLVREPTCFIVSGRRPQRKEFQKVIRRLKGKYCRDSHQWSYQATHFIAPEPIRRTEKFFAAAASGRWILKAEYLSACSQAGTFLPEEPYELYKDALAEDGIINLKAPRKWRLLRERTGHGAFHGMKIVIYGECFAPPLETLKRAVKAGGGTILATCPPYTRFLDCGIDYAVIRISVGATCHLQHPEMGREVI
ncbi:BRCT domain-containing protein At4g02110 [Linum perenne]